MVAKVRHECERCGLEAVLERAGRYRDEDFLEAFHELMGAQAAARWYAREALRLSKMVEALRAGIAWRDFELALRVAELRSLGVEPMDTDPVQEI